MKYNIQALAFEKPVCVGACDLVDKSFEELRDAGAAQIVTCNTISHISNCIDLSPIIIEALK